MAEAHSAVAFSFSITHEGWHLNYDREVLDLVWQSGVRSWKKRVARFRTGVRNGVYPAHLQSLWLVIAVAIALHFTQRQVPFNLVNKCLALLPGDTVGYQVTACGLAGLFFWLCICYTMRYSLKLLLMYKGWMYEKRAPGSKVSLPTRVWALFVKVLATWNKPGLYSFQGSLPRLPLPSVKDTMARYLRSVKPLLDDDNYTRMERLANEFQNGIATKLQRYLLLKSWWSTNYVSDWWEEYVYLRSRGALMVNSNFYGMDAIFTKPTTVRSARAANVINMLLQFRRIVERQELEPILVQGLVPLCSWQYERIFNTVRVPGVESDKIVHYQDSNHIVVLFRGCYYKVVIYHNGRILRPCEIQIQIEEILHSHDKPQPGEELLASLTAGDRTKWAKVRESVFAKGVNKTSLHLIESSAFVLSLDEQPFEFDMAHPEKLDQFGRNLLHGNGHDRWFDKSFTVCIGSNARVGFNAEHTWADAAVMSHIWEMLIMEEAQPRADAPVLAHVWENIVAEEQIQKRYDENGNTLGIPEFEPPKPKRLAFDLDNSEALDAIQEAHLAAQKLLNDVDLRIFVHDAYGKGLMKKCRLSPDAFLQMALQLAYYRDAGKFSLTYEASMTRLFREGRTETVRPCTIESAAWVKAMEDPSCSVQERVKLLNAACDRHQLGYQDAMCGMGIDRHLFCLYVVSKYLELDSPFLKEVLSEPWRLSTSQTPHGQTAKMDLKKHPDCISAGGGFGPVADDGYGVSYIVAGEDLIFFHISSKKSCGSTSSERFAQQIARALADLKHLFEQYKTQQQKNVTNGTAN
ncbi:carnitine O-palmitoyltransferase 1, liver isoform isoform X1 [Topomyia yanbarensis]|uniref:carnitine O-palmitoyltransferase 1, liver isoform isoform X1 n=1 Tax=Topomyia yanbarensis TaxID=2498891 RepID=UPI00273B7A6A|nr:carnitine O-palmitoyltransferase 1, liver isoform isoform X1 [Topomyia yanbarensis]XP_058815519.1 carnitine O-palmitoyltransferase 1, liver isoform isoform X1 [Topomyia yanbarensis]